MRYPKTLASCPGCDTFLPPNASLCPSCGLDACGAGSPVTRHTVSAVALLGLAAAAIAGCGDDDSSSVAGAYGAGGTFDVGAGAASSEGGAGGGVSSDGGAPGVGGAGGGP